MLVVSRKQNETVKFPNLGISVEILRVSGNTVRVGIDAPREIRVLRGELADDQEFKNVSEAGRQQSAQQTEALKNEQHQLNNRLNAANLALHLMQKQLEVGRVADAEKTLAQTLKTFEELDQLMANPKQLKRIEKKQSNSRRALVVEDNANERELLAGYLRLCGYEVDTVCDGVDAMTYLETNEQPDVVLIDMQMPRMDGRKTISEIRSNPRFKGLKVFAVSGSEQSELGVPSGDRGVDRWFEKPLRPAEFAEELSRQCASVN